MQSESFDRLSKSMASQRSRRGLLKAFVGGVGAAALATLLPRSLAEQARVEAAAVPSNPMTCKQLCFNMFGPTAAAAACAAQGLQGTGPCAGPTCPAGTPTGCFAQCLNGPPNAAGCSCVPTVSGASACVQEICTFVSCTSDAGCPNGQVCFTLGCCGVAPPPGTGFCVPVCTTFVPGATTVPLPAARPAGSGSGWGGR